MEDFWNRNIIDPGKLPPLLALAAFIVTFLITRLITRMIRSGRGPFRDNVSADGTHIHHSVPGLFLLVTGAFTAISATNSPWLELSALAVGAGTSLVLDEFALILHLKDVYWSQEGRISVEIVGLAAAVLAFVTIGLVPFGVDSMDLDEFGLRVTLTTSFALNAVMVLLCLLKGKYRFALVGIFVPLTAWVAALRLARPNSWWAHRWYREGRMAKAVARDIEFQSTWDPRWERLGYLVAGRPTAVLSSAPAVKPTAVLSSAPALMPTAVLSSAPAEAPVAVPSDVPAAVPAAVLTELPTTVKTTAPNEAMTALPASAPNIDSTPGFIRLIKRIPFTTTYVAITMALAVMTGTLWTDLESKSWYQNVAFGLPAFADGRWYTLILGNFFALYPAYYLFVAGAFALITGFAEWKLGTKRTIVVCVGYQVLAVLLTALFFWIFRDTNWPWVAERATETDVGFSAGMLAAVSVASAAVHPPWRLRLRLMIWTYVLFSIMFVGQMADAEHVFAVCLSLPFSTRLAGAKGLKMRALPTRREVRLLAFTAGLVVAVSQLVSQFLPTRLTPFGAEAQADDKWYLLVLNLIVNLLIANGLRQGRRWAWWLEIILLAIPLALSLVVGVAYIYFLTSGESDSTLDAVPQFAANAILSLAFFLLLFLARGIFTVPRSGKRRLATSSSNPEMAKELLRKWGGDTISWMTTWPDNRHMITKDGESYLAFRRHAGVAVALGDPVGPPGSARATVADFVALCDKVGLVPCIFSCTAETIAATDALGWKSAQVAQDNLIDLTELEFKGKKWQDIRTALNRAEKEGVTFRMVQLSEEPWSLVRQVEHLSQEWLGDKKLPEMGFTLGGVTEALDTEVKVGVAVGADGMLHGVTSWMPVYGADDEVSGWTLDLMRRADGGFRATMEFLLASSCLYFKEQGAGFVSLSGAPLAKSGTAEGIETAVDKFLETLGAQLEPVYGFRSLHAFKSKFQPRLEPLYMAFRDEADLPRIGIAITRAYLPTAGIRDIVSMARH